MASEEPNPGAPQGAPQGLELEPRPRVTRLNKRALGVGIGLLCLVVIAAILSLAEVSRRQQQRADETPPPEAAADPFWESEPDGVAQPPREPEALEAPPEVPAQPPGGPSLVPAQLAQEDPEERERKARLRRARDARPRVPGFRRSAGARTGARLPGGSAPSSRTEIPSFERELLGALGEGSEAPDELVAQNNQEGKRAFLRDAGRTEAEFENPHRVRQPASDYEVVAGSIIPAVLVTQANSDLPGLMTARVRENVYDTKTGHHLLIPQGTLVVGVYDSTVTFGQERLLVAWQRLVFPDGSKLNLGSMPGVDLAGAAGLRDRVDRHFWRTFGSALLMSVLSGGLQLSQDRESGEDTSRREDIRSTLSASLGQNIGELATRTLRRHQNVQPRIEIRPGYRFNVFVQRDLVLDRPYAAS